MPLLETTLRVCAANWSCCCCCCCCFILCSCGCVSRVLPKTALLVCAANWSCCCCCCFILCSCGCVGPVLYSVWWMLWVGAVSAMGAVCDESTRQHCQGKVAAAVLSSVPMQHSVDCRLCSLDVEVQLKWLDCDHAVCVMLSVLRTLCETGCCGRCCSLREQLTLAY